jgi:hypothetical protein
MLKVRICEDLEEAERIWRAHWPANHIFDLWDVRACFQDVFNRRPYFLVAEENGAIEGLMALSWIEDEEYFGHFPGETYQGKTWLEQNRILARDSKILRALFRNIPGGTRLRYLIRDSILFGDAPPVEDETGYVFLPGKYDYSFGTYFQSFSSKSRKKLAKEISRFQEAGLSFHYDRIQDMDLMFQMNLDAFGEMSFFSDPMFLRSFDRLILWLNSKGMLRITTAMVNGEVAAVDVGCVRDACYAVLAGGVNPAFPGVAKLINFHHMEWACRNRMQSVDFLCGDYGWKERFHLSPRPLYKIETPSDIALSRIPRASYYVRKK